MRLLENGSEVKFTTHKGETFHKKVSELHPMMDERMFMQTTNPAIKSVFFHFHTDGQQFIIGKSK